MYNHIRKQIRTIAALALLMAMAIVPAVAAQQSSSSNYQVNDVFFGAGGELNACSSSYCAKQSAGETGVGKACSTTYCAQAGFNTNREPSLTLIVPAQNVDVGVLTPGQPKTAHATFSVKSYLSSGYVVQTKGSAPTYSGHQLAPMTTVAASNPGQEQFGINLVANTTGCGAPVDFGADPSQAPDSTFSFGWAWVGYNTCGMFKYNNGDTMAYSTSSSGETDYTISYLFNASPVTPAGTYKMNQSLVATATF